MSRKVLFSILLILILIFALSKIMPKLKSKGGFELGMDIETKKTKKKAKIENLEPPTIKLNLLDENLKEKVFSIGRNIFRYGAPKPPDVPQFANQNINRENLRTPPKVISEPLISNPPTSPVQPDRPPKREPPSFTYKYLGFFGPPDKKLAVFSDGRDIIDAFEGETLSDKFILKNIGFESVTIGFVDFPEDITQKIEVGP